MTPARFRHNWAARRNANAFPTAGVAAALELDQKSRQRIKLPHVILDLWGVIPSMSAAGEAATPCLRHPAAGRSFRTTKVSVI